jgi:hypothetical protein
LNAGSQSVRGRIGSANGESYSGRGGADAPPVCVRIELWMFVAVLNSGSVFTVPPVVVTSELVAGEAALEFVAAVGAAEV